MSSTSLRTQGGGLAAAPVTATLADELDLDFAASGSEEEDEERDEEAEAQQQEHEQDDTSAEPVRGPLNDKRWQQLEDILQRIQEYQDKPPSGGAVEDDPQYKLLAEANSFSTSIDDHAAELHKRIRDIYSGRFPELETLLPDPLEYTKAVAVIGNGPFTMDTLRDLTSKADNILHTPLSAVLSRPKLMTVTVEATTTTGESLPEHLVSAVQESCKQMLRLENARRTITSYVESRMNLFCPNLTELVGSFTAAQLVTARGGLTGLATTRAANLPSIGSKRFAASGLATNTGIRNQGHIYHSDLISRFRPELKTQAMRIVSAKVVLAARIDLAHSSPDGSEGVSLLEQCERRLDKLTAAPPSKSQRALPAPDDRPSKKRGGRRARKAKEATAMTDLRKAQNRMAFGREEAEVGYGTGEGTAGLGMIGQESAGRVRALQVDQRTRAKLSKKNQGWGAGAGGAGASGALGGNASSLRALQGPGGGAASVLKGHGLRASGVATSLGAAGGTASSLAFTPKQGIELVDPKVRKEMERRARGDEDRWFKGGTFTQVGGGGAASNANGDGAGFKVPALPAKRKAEE